MVDQHTYHTIVQLLQADANHRYIAQVCSVDVQIVGSIADSTFVYVRVEKPRKLAKTEIKTRGRRTPVSMPPFPDLSLLDDPQRVIVLTKRGLPVPKIKRHLKSPLWTDRQINRYVTKKLGPARKGTNNSKSNWLNPQTVDMVTQILTEKFGKDQYHCEICLDPVPKGCSLHHTKYEGATIFDLLFVCQSCNLARENKGLA